jgi:hypothetical protein
MFNVSFISVQNDHVYFFLKYDLILSSVSKTHSVPLMALQPTLYAIMKKKTLLHVKEYFLCVHFKD